MKEKNETNVKNIEKNEETSTVGGIDLTGLSAQALEDIELWETGNIEIDASMDPMAAARILDMIKNNSIKTNKRRNKKK
jgi:hypothetical protein